MQQRSLMKRVNITELPKRGLSSFRTICTTRSNHTRFTAFGATSGTTTFGVVTAAAASQETQLEIKFRW
jgi:hypothetical protein